MSNRPIDAALKGKDFDRYWRLIRLRNFLLAMLTQVGNAIDEELEGFHKLSAEKELYVLSNLNHYEDGKY